MREYAVPVLMLLQAACMSVQVAPAAAQTVLPDRAAEASQVVNLSAPQRLPLERPPVPTLATQPSAGSADPRSPSPRFGILGNLGGLRDVLWQNGVLLNAAYDYQSATNIQGGLRGPILRGAGQFAVRGLLDFDRMLGLEGATGAVTITQRAGRDVTADARLGTQTSVEEIFGRGRIWRLSQFWYNQKLTSWADIKIGRVPLSDDFAGFACEFQLLALCGNQPGKLVGSYWYNFPVSQWATRLRLSMPGVAYAQIGAYQVNPDNVVDGFSFDFSRGTGALIVSELGWSPKFGPHGLAGSYKFGGWYETGGGNDVLLNAEGLPRPVAGGAPLHRDVRYGFYLVGVQEVFRPDPADPSRNLSIFVRASYADQATTPYSAQETAGLVYKGFLAERPNDWIGFGFGQTVVNPRVVDGLLLSNLVRAAAAPLPTRERFFEIFYSIAVTADLVVRPNIQYLNRPSGLNLRPDVLVFGVKSALTF